ncbi:MAG: HAD family hydrolase [Firmicutes bacterium]|nr:HAD family hydrolase [Bacillota bacterium]MBQ4093182.1 HAD family hydrolase [Bacillota bacterium]
MTQKRDSILFDLDGTLWDAVSAITKIWNEGIQGDPAVKALLTEENVRSIMGLNTKEIGAALFPYLSEEKQWDLMLQCGEAEKRLLPKTGGILYPYLEETLQNLSSQYPLFIVSNCDEGYIEAFLTYHQLSAYFTDHLCYGDTKRDKPYNIRAIVEKHHCQNPVYVGDTVKDYLSATEAGVAFIHAAYGYGKVPEAKERITDLRELPKILHK